MKFVIEFEDEPIGKGLYRAVGFNALVFDAVGLSKLDRYDKRAITHDAYENGKKWGYQQGYEAGFAEGRKRTELSQAQDDEIMVGDEVIAPASDIHGEAVVFRIEEDYGKRIYYAYSTGVAGWDHPQNLKKTGRHYDEINRLLEALKK